MHKHRYMKRIIPVALVVLIFLYVVMREKSPAEPQAVMDMKNVSYVSMTQVDDELYVVDYSGKIYSMDWYTGEMELFSKGVGSGQAWISDRTLENLYYIKDGTLCHMSTATGKKEQLVSVPETSEILTATESCVLLLQEDGYYVLHLDTLESSRVYFEESCIFRSWVDRGYVVYVDTSGSEPNYTDNAIVTFITGAGDEVYVALEYKDERQNEIQRWNLATGEKTVLYTSDKGLAMVYDGVIAEDRVYFYEDTNLYTMKIGEEPVQVGGCIEGSTDGTVACSDGSVIFTNYMYGAIIKRYIPEENRSVILTDEDAMLIRYAAVFDGRYAIMSRYYAGTHGSRLLIADIPKEE